MMRNFADILKYVNIDIEREYNKLYEIFYDDSEGDSIADIISDDFRHFLYRGTCFSLEEFNDQHEIAFESNPEVVSAEYLARFCEYVYNVLQFYTGNALLEYNINTSFIYEQIERVIDVIDYTIINDGNVNIFVPRDNAAIEVAQSSIIPDDLSYKVLSYKHHSYCGDIHRKKDILLSFANILEPNRKQLKCIDKELADCIFYAFNNLDLRHNNQGTNIKSDVFHDMDMNAKEHVYDQLYELCLIAFMQLEHRKSIDAINALKNDV